jgi:hypothetical protein
MKMKYFYSAILLFLTVKVSAQVSEDFNKATLSTGTLACWESAFERQAFTSARVAAPTPQPLNMDTRLALVTTAPIAGSASLRVTESLVVPIYQGAASTETFVSPAYGNDGDEVSFKVRVNSVDLPTTNESLYFMVICGNDIYYQLFNSSDVGNSITVNRTISGSGGGGIIKIAILYRSLTFVAAVSSYSYSLDIDDFSTTADVSPSNTCMALPVTLISFSANSAENAINLNWATTEETNADYYEIQQSNDTKHWSVLGKVNATGESSTIQKYSFEYPGTKNRPTYYRLRMVDTDQTFAYSKIVRITLDKNSLSLYPNPSSDFITLPFTKGIATIFNTNGKVVQRGAIGDNLLDIRNLRQGIYIVQYNDNNGKIISSRLVVNR